MSFYEVHRSNLVISYDGIYYFAGILYEVDKETLEESIVLYNMYIRNPLKQNRKKHPATIGVTRCFFDWWR